MPAAPRQLRYHWLRLRAFCHPTEDPAKVEAAVRFLAGVEDEEFRASLRNTSIESHHGAQLLVIECSLERSRAIRDLLQKLFDLPGARDALASTADARTDDEGVFYARFDKQEALQKRMVLTQGEDAVQMRLKLEVYPAHREAALAAIRQLLAMERV